MRKMSLKWINDGMQIDERGGSAELETNVSKNNPFDNFSFKVMYKSPPKIPCHPSIRLLQL